MDAVLASSMEFDEYVRRKRELNDSKSPLSVLGFSMSNNSSSLNRNQSKINGANKSMNNTNINNNLPPTYSSYSYKHSWSMHLNSNLKENNSDSYNNDNHGNLNHVTPTKTRWSSSRYDDHDILSLNGGVEGITKNFTKYSPYSVTEIPEPDNDYISYNYNNENESQNISINSKSNYEKHQYDKYIERYLGMSSMEMDMVNSPSSSNYSPPATLSAPKERRQNNGPYRKPAVRSPERLVKEFRLRCNKDALIHHFDRWRRCAWLDREASTKNETTLRKRHVHSILNRAMKLWQETRKVSRHRNCSMYRKGLHSLFFNMHSRSNERESTHRAIHHYVRQSTEKSMLAFRRALMDARKHTRKVVLGEIADRFRGRKLLHCCWQGWSRWCSLQQDLKLIDIEREQRRQRIHSLVGTMKARNANPPAPPNTPIPASDAINHKNRGVGGKSCTTSTSSTARNKNRKNLNPEQEEAFPKSNSTTTRTTSNISTATTSNQNLRERSRNRLRIQNQSQNQRSESKPGQRESERDDYKDDRYDEDAKNQRQRPSMAEEKERPSMAEEKERSRANVEVRVADVADAKHELKEDESKKEMNSESSIDGTNSKYRSLDEIPLDARLERQRFIRSHAEARVAKLRTRQEEEQRRKQQEADEAFERERQDKHRERQEMKEKSEKHRRRLTEDETVEKKRLLNLATRFRRSQLLTRCGLGPWQRLLALRDESDDKALRFRNDTLKERIWMALYAYYKSEKSSRIRREYAQSHLASVHFKKGLMRRTLQFWLLCRRLLKAKAIAVSGHSSKFCVKKRALKAWQVALQKAIRTETHKMRLYASRGDKISMKHYFSEWCKYHEEMILEKEIQYRTDVTWKRVQAWLL